MFAPRHHHPAGSTIAGRYKYAVQENVPDHSPAAGLDRNEVGALLVTAGLDNRPSTLISLLALNGLRVAFTSRKPLRP